MKQKLPPEAQNSPNRYYWYTKLCSNTDVTFDDFNIVNWYHPAGDGLRLNHMGFNLFSEAYTVYPADIVKSIRTSGNILQLIRFCKHPYYIDTNKIYFTNSEECITYVLCDGDFDSIELVS